MNTAKKIMWPKFHTVFNSVGESASGPPTKKNGTTNRINNPDNQEGKLAFKIAPSHVNNHKRTIHYKWLARSLAICND